MKIEVIWMIVIFVVGVLSMMIISITMYKKKKENDLNNPMFSKTMKEINFLKDEISKQKILFKEKNIKGYKSLWYINRELKLITGYEKQLSFVKEMYDENKKKLENN